MYWCSTIELIASNNDRSNEWLVSLARRNDGEDMELNRCIILEQVGALNPSR